MFAEVDTGRSDRKRSLAAGTRSGTPGASRRPPTMENDTVTSARTRLTSQDRKSGERRGSRPARRALDLAEARGRRRQTASRPALPLADPLRADPGEVIAALMTSSLGPLRWRAHLASDHRADHLLGESSSPSCAAWEIESLARASWHQAETNRGADPVRADYPSATATVGGPSALRNHDPRPPALRDEVEEGLEAGSHLVSPVSAAACDPRVR